MLNRSNQEAIIMCGIVGILGTAAVAPQLVDALKRLEYRGYDSAGIATLDHSRLDRRRASGKLRNLEAELAANPLAGFAGIGHTRWATHGGPTVANAHPHIGLGVSVVHNGIIENYRELREEVEMAGIRHTSDTDTETVAHLVSLQIKAGLTPQAAVSAVLPRLKGAFALAFIFEGHDDLMIGARKGSPLAVGYGNGEMYLGSDAIALAPFTDQISYLEEGDCAFLTRKTLKIVDDKGYPVKREMQKSAASAFMVDKGNHKHFMAKEIAEQPDVIARTIAHYIDMTKGTVKMPALPFNWAHLPNITITACGTAYYAGLIGKYWFEKLARLPVEIDVASEFRYREAPLSKGGLTLVVSQSGETADTLAGLRYAKAQGQHTMGVVNVTTSTIAREASVCCPIKAGPEVGVASTKAFTCQLTVLYCLAVFAGRARGVISEERERELVQAITEVPRLMNEALKLEPALKTLAKQIAKTEDVFYLGRGTSYPLAMEGALKLKEISYIHAEGYAAGELKHGPIALIDEKMPVIVIAPHDAVYEKTVSNMQEVAARGGKIVLFTDRKGLEEAGINPLASFILPDMAPEITPLVYALPTQLLAYHTAVHMGTDVDQPRNLAKSVTVE
jgi:glutamine---fructose-6-phosphate transaminase (isomerizing)